MDTGRGTILAGAPEPVRAARRTVDEAVEDALAAGIDGNPDAIAALQAGVPNGGPEVQSAAVVAALAE